MEVSCRQEMSKLLPGAALVEHALMTIIYFCCRPGPRFSSAADLSATMRRSLGKGERERGTRDGRQLPCFVNCTYLHLSWQLQAPVNTNRTMVRLTAGGTLLGCCCGKRWIWQHFIYQWFVMQSFKGFNLGYTLDVRLQWIPALQQMIHQHTIKKSICIIKQQLLHFMRTVVN